MTQQAIELRRVTRRFGREMAVDCLSLTQEKGRILGLVGLPDAGKTTLIHLVAGLEKPTAGHVQVLGGSPLAAPIRARIGFAPNPQLLDPSKTPKEILYHLSRLKGSVPSVSYPTLPNSLSASALSSLEIPSCCCSMASSMILTMPAFLCWRSSFAGEQRRETPS